MNRDLFRSLFLYCAKHKYRGTQKYYLSSSRKQKGLDPINEYLLSFNGVNHQLCSSNRGKSRVNAAVFLDPRSDHYIFIIYLKIADTLNFVIARKPIIKGFIACALHKTIRKMLQ